MSRIQVVPFDVETAGQETWSAFHAYRRAVAAELYPDETVWSDAECEHEMRRSHPHWDSRHWLALDGADVVGDAGAGFRRPGTPNAEEHVRFLSGWGTVLAAARRKGIGALLLRQVHALMQAMDKSVLTLSAETDAGHAFLAHAGAAAKNSSLESRILLEDVDELRLRTWEGVAGDIGLVFECYAGRVPREVLLSLLPTFATLALDIPLGSLETPPIRYEIEGYDQWYVTLDRTGGVHHLVLLRAPDGTVAGITEASWDSRSPKIADQVFTAIARPWRGRGLAGAIKAAILRQVRSSHPDAAEMRTYNAESNAPILAINKRLGFTVRRRHVAYQVTRAELDTRL